MNEEVSKGVWIKVFVGFVILMIPFWYYDYKAYKLNKGFDVNLVVFDENGNVVKGATIDLFLNGVGNGAKHGSIKTNKNGEARLKDISSGGAEIMVYYEDYELQTIELDRYNDNLIYLKRQGNKK